MYRDQASPSWAAQSILIKPGGELVTRYVGNKFPIKSRLNQIRLTEYSNRWSTILQN